MGVLSGFTKKNIEFGKFSIPGFHQASYCMCNNFKNHFIYPPAIKIGYTNVAFPHKYIMLWLMNVTNADFYVCTKEMLPFSGLKQIIVKYVAVGNNSIEFPEFGKKHLTRTSYMR